MSSSKAMIDTRCLIRLMEEFDHNMVVPQVSSDDAVIDDDVNGNDDDETASKEMETNNNKNYTNNNDIDRSKIMQRSSRTEKEVDDDEEEEDDDDDDEEGAVDHDDIEDLVVDDYDEQEEDGDMEEQDVEARVSFIQTCLRIARNDETMKQAVDCWTTMEHAAPAWRGSDVLLLGNALVGNTHLQSLKIEKQCRFKQRMEHDIVMSLCRGIGQSHIQQLYLVHICRRLEEDMLVELGGGLPLSSTLQQLTLVEIPMDMNAFGNFVMNASSLTHLTLTGCFSTDADMKLLSQSLFTSSSSSSSNNKGCLLQSLDLSGNHITDVGIHYFCESWGQHDSTFVSLQELVLSMNDIGTDGLQALITTNAARQKTSTTTTTTCGRLRKLVLESNRKIGYPGLQIIGEHLAHSLCGLQHLNMERCAKMSTRMPTTSKVMRYGACRALANGLRANNTSSMSLSSSLISLHLGNNELGVSGAQMILQAVAGHPTLQSLSLARDESIGLAGIKLLGMELPHATLKELDLDFCVSPRWPNAAGSAKLANEAGQALLQGVQQNETLTHVSFFELPLVWKSPIQFYTRRNALCRPLIWRRRRRHVGEDDNAPDVNGHALEPSAWPLALARFLGEPKNEADDHFQRHASSFVYHCLLEQPWLVVSSSSSSLSSTTPQVNNNEHTNVRRDRR